jgi:CMP-N,N'-diacetyllegionaminic acid synthase
MINGLTILAVIPARGDSKRFPGKNLAVLGGKPLIAWSIEAAQCSSLVDRTVVSSDSAEIIDVARRFGADAPFVRPAHLAADDTSTWETVAHVLDEVPGFDLVALLQPTSPLRSAADVDAAIELSADRGLPVVGVCRASKPPEWLYYLVGDRMEPVFRSERVPSRWQDARPAFAINGAVYVASVESLRANEGFLGPTTLAYEMPRERSVDIDDEFDFRVASSILHGVG